jgi:hypothetical protein
MKSVFHATDIYSALWPLHFVSRIFILAPSSLKPESKSVKHEIIITYFSLIWSIFCIIRLVAVEYIFVTKTIVANVTLKHKITGTLDTVSLFSYYIITLFLTLKINRGKIPEVLGKCSDRDHPLSSKLYGTQIYMNTRLILTLQFAITTSIIIINYAAVCVTDDNFSIIDKCLVFTLTMSAFLNCTAILHFMKLVLLLRNKYKYLNSVQDSTALMPCNITYLNFRNMNYMIPIEIYTSTIQPSIAEPRENCISTRRQHFHKLGITFSQLHDVAFFMNSTYGFSALSGTFCAFITINLDANYVIEIRHTGIHIYVSATVF